MIKPIPPLSADITLRIAEQLGLLQSFSTIDYTDLIARMENGQSRYKKDNGRFDTPDALVLHCMLRTIKPNHIIEIGSGMSSCMIMDTNEGYFNNEINCTFIDIDTSALMEYCRAADITRNTIIESPIQDIDITPFLSLQAGDILFVDSSHIYSPGSDVFDIIHRILPVIRSGVHIHFHDIFHDFHYPTEWGKTDWNEVQIIQSFLSQHPQYSVEFFSSYLSHVFSEDFRTTFPILEYIHGGSLWLKKTS